MSIQPRHILAALVAAFIVGTVGGGVLAAGGGDGTSAIPAGITAADLKAEAEAAKRAAAKAERAAQQAAIGDWSAQAIFEKKTGRIVISGIATGLRPGTRVVVQRRQGSAWTDFPADTTIGPDGSYAVWVKTNRTGENTFRVADAKSGEASEPATITV